jgi:hypothetical protein
MRADLRPSSSSFTVNTEVNPREAEDGFVESVQGKIKRTGTVGALTLCLHVVSTALWSGSRVPRFRATPRRCLRCDVP